MTTASTTPRTSRRSTPRASACCGITSRSSRSPRAPAQRLLRAFARARDTPTPGSSVSLPRDWMHDTSHAAQINCGRLISCRIHGDHDGPGCSDLDTDYLHGSACAVRPLYRKARTAALCASRSIPLATAARIRGLDEALRTLGHDGVWATTAGEIADHYYRTATTLARTPRR